MFPSLVNCCTIDWFMIWPEDALISVAKQFLAKVKSLPPPPPFPFPFPFSSCYPPPACASSFPDTLLPLPPPPHTRTDRPREHGHQERRLQRLYDDPLFRPQLRSQVPAGASPTHLHDAHELPGADQHVHVDAGAGEEDDQRQGRALPERLRQAGGDQRHGLAAAGRDHQAAARAGGGGERDDRADQRRDQGQGSCCSRAGQRGAGGNQSEPGDQGGQRHQGGRAEGPG
eukprot:757455-Hanusia_phi.AAC.1